MLYNVQYYAEMRELINGGILTIPYEGLAVISSDSMVRFPYVSFNSIVNFSVEY